MGSLSVAHEKLSDTADVYILIMVTKLIDLQVELSLFKHLFASSAKKMFRYLFMCN